MTIDAVGNIHSESTGRFAGHVHTEADPATLAQTDVLCDPRVVAALGAGPELTVDEERALRILLDPVNDLSEEGLDFEETVDLLAGLIAGDLDSIGPVAERVDGYYSRTDGYGAFGLDLIRDSDGSCDYLHISINEPSTPNRLTVGADLKYFLGEPGGLRMAARSAANMIEYREQLVMDLTRLSRPAITTMHKQVALLAHIGGEYPVKFTSDGGDTTVEGTLRTGVWRPGRRGDNSFEPASDLDPRDGWVRITTRQGFDTWRPFAELTALLEAGDLAFSGH